MLTEKGILKKILQTAAACLVLSALITSLNFGALSARAAWDGYAAEETVTSLNTELINFNQAIEILKTGGSLDRSHTKNGNNYSIGWTDMSSVPELYLSSPVSDWTDYEYMEFWIYSEAATGDSIIVLAESERGADNSWNYYNGVFTVDWSGWKKVVMPRSSMGANRNPDWKKIRQVRFCSAGWGINPNGAASKLYIADVRITDGDGTSLYGIYSDLQIQKAKDAMSEAAAVYANSPNVVTADGKVETLTEDANVCTYKICDTVMVPLSFFEKYMGAQVTETEADYTIVRDTFKLRGSVYEKEYTVNGKTGSFEQPSQIFDGRMYIDAAGAAQVLGLETVKDRALVVVGKNEAIKVLERPSGVNELSEIIAYLAAHINMSNKVMSDEDFKAVKDNWRYELVGSVEDNDISNQHIAEKIKSVNNAGKNAQSRMIKTAGQTELFEGITTTASSHMTSTYSMLYNMALAYGTSGCELYLDENLKNDILYGLKWMYENRYGQAEIDGTGWRSTADYNWWDWQIGSPRWLVSILMIMEDQLTQKEITDYLSLFDKLVPTPVGLGSNAMHTARLAVGSALLQKDTRKIIRMQNSMEKTLLYVDNGRNAQNMLYGDRGPKKTKGEGFYTDGSYIFHTLHPMNGTYGMEHFALVGPFVSMFEGTPLEMTTPSIDNISDWIYNAFDPLIYQGAIFRMVKGRAPGGLHLAGSAILGSMIDSMNCLSPEDCAAVGSIIKAQVRDDTSIDYYNTLSLPQVIKLTQIMNDTAIETRESLMTNHVYYNEDKVVHQRGNFALGISMSSSRIFNYECINNENLQGWYLGDGMTEYYTKGNFTQSQDNYWKYVNPYRLPGTTVDTQLRKAVSINQGNEYLSSKDFVGGVSLDNTYGTAAMWLESYHNDTDFGKESADGYGGKAPAHNSNLQAKKAWFMFDDEVVCLGNDINADNGCDVLTVVDNKMASKTRNITTKVNDAYNIANVYASDTPEPENVALNTIDGRFDTKWASESGAAITWDIGKSDILGFIQLSFQNGTKRKQKFTLEISEDGKSWSEVFNGSSTGTTEFGEIFSLGDRNGRYVRFTNLGNSAGSTWVSLTTAAIYPPNPDGSLALPEEKYVGLDKFISDGNEINLSGKDTNLTGTRWAHMENVGGYYFPAGGDIFAKYTESVHSFMELWFNHGNNPSGAAYAYTLLPGKTAAETKEYSEKPDIEIVENRPELQVVKEKTLNVTGMVFWEAGTYNGITASKPMIVMLKEEGGKTTVSVCDPTQLLTEAELTFDKELTAVKHDPKINITTADKTRINIDFTDSDGRSMEFVLQGTGFV